MTRPRAVLFDWDNTLVDSWPTIHDALHHTFTRMGHAPWSLAEVKARTRLSLAESFPPLFGDRWQDARQLYFDRFHAIHLDRIKPLPGAETMLDALISAGLPLGVVSNKTGATLRREVAHFGWDPRFKTVVGAGDASADKPAAAPILKALEPIGLQCGADIWYVGDTAMDMECARNAGCSAILLHKNDADEELHVRFPPKHRFGDCDTMVAYIKGL